MESPTLGNRGSRIVPQNESKRQALQELVKKKEEAERRKMDRNKQTDFPKTSPSTLDSLMGKLDLTEKENNTQNRNQNQYQDAKECTDFDSPGSFGIPSFELSTKKKKSVEASRVPSHIHLPDEEEEVGEGEDSYSFPPVILEKKKEKSREEREGREGSEGKALSPSDFILGEGQFVLPGNVASGLYPHQKEGIEWMWGLRKKGCGGILGDDMGLGKTRQVASFLLGLFNSKLAKRVLVVLPSTLLAPWRQELQFVGLKRKARDFVSTMTPRQRAMALEETLECGGVLLTTYEMVPGHVEELLGKGSRAHQNGKKVWDYLILDEAHKVKNPATKGFKGLKSLEYSHCIMMTGTPLQNNLKELWALYNICYENLLGDKKEFREVYERIITDGTDKNASNREKLNANKAAEKLRTKITPFMLRRLKGDIFNSGVQASVPQDQTVGPIMKSAPTLPRKDDLIVWLPLTERQRKLYISFLHSDQVKTVLNETKSVLAAITVLKKICDDPSLLNENSLEEIIDGADKLIRKKKESAGEMQQLFRNMIVNENGTNNIISDSKSSCKLEFMKILVKDLVSKGHRVLIFSQRTKMLDTIQKHIEEEKVPFCRIDGSIPPAMREKQVEEFQTNPRIPIFLLSSQVGGLGITLTGADRVIIVDPAWNPSVDNQSVDRAYRIGQKKEVVIYRLITAGTVEEKIYRKQIYKGGLMKIATEEKEQLRYFSHQDLADLFTVPKGGFDVSETQQQLHEEHADQHIMSPEMEAHTKFLVSQKAVGISYHTLLFSKAAPQLPDLPDEPEPQPLRNSGSQQSISSWKALAEKGSSSSRQGPGGGIMATAQQALDKESNSVHEKYRKAKSTCLSLEEQLGRFEKLRTLQLPDNGTKLNESIQSTQLQLQQARNAVEKYKQMALNMGNLNLNSPPQGGENGYGNSRNVIVL